MALFCAFLLSNCSSQTGQKKQTANNKKTAQQKYKNIKPSITAQQYVDLAKEANSPSSIALLIQASEQYIIEGNSEKALWLTNRVKAIAEDDNQRYQIALNSANALLMLNEVEHALTQLNVAKNLATQTSQQHNKRYFKLLAKVQQLRGLRVASLDAQLRFSALDNNENNDTVNEATLLLWQRLVELSEWQLQLLVKLNPPNIKGWQQLLTYTHQFGHIPERLKRYISQWQRKYSDHPGQDILGSLQIETIESVQVNNIAVILPLSGRQQAAGEVVQQGLLAAYQENNAKNLHFIDANDFNMADLSEEFTEKNIDYVIGPLLKSNVNAYLQQTELSIPTLLLNLPDSDIPAIHSALSMRHEDEAIQAATTLSQFDYQRPIVLSQQNGISKRIAKSFVQQWEKITGITPELVYFEQGRQMQNQIKTSLDVNFSQQRINELRRRISQTLKTEARNRRDVDMIYLVSSPTETRLLKPYIDVNISPFAKLIPIYASSRSHSVKADTNENRDLDGLIFTEIPWRLSSRQQNSKLSALSQKIWPNRSNSLQSLFAVGYDSLSLIEKLPAMKQSPYIRHYGQTGVLQLNKNNVLSRSLLWGRYQQEKVEEFAMD